MSTMNRQSQAKVDPSTDPFASRPGRTLTWSDVSLTAKQKNEEKKILTSLSGSIKPKQLTAIIGHSGAGKTSLLNVLAGKTVSSKTMTVSRTMTLDGVDIDPSAINVKRKIAFVAQQDTLLATATPREAIRFSAKLRLKADVSDLEIEALVERILYELRIDHVADSITGGENVRGLSGGEMRRLSLAIELVVRPSILFCDEVTSGLDSHNAATVMEVLKRLANCGATVLTTIHQPASKVFNLIDHLILMNQGRCMYQGSVQRLPRYFSMRGYEIPQNYNPADFIVEVSQTEKVQDLTQAGFFDGSCGKDEDEEALDEESGEDNVTGSFECSLTQSSEGSAGHSYEESIEQGEGSAPSINDQVNSSSFKVPAPPNLNRNMSIFDALDWSSRARLRTEIWVQIVRDLQKLARDSRAMMLRFMIVIVGSVIISIAFSGAGNNSLESSTAFTGHVGAMFFLIMTNMIALQLIMLDQIETRPIFIREYETDHYRLFSYGCAKIVTEALATLGQVLTLLLIVYWTVGLEASFGTWFITLYLFCMVMTSTGVALASFTKDARDAKELIPIALLPQILFCGFFVSTDSLPSFLQWMQWLFPLTYTFRILLSQEFAFCLERDEVLEAGEMCVNSLLNALGNAKGRFQNLYNTESLVRLTQTGQYYGVDDIEEYFSLFSQEEFHPSAVVVKGCAVDESMRFKFNGLSEDGVCDLTVSDVSQGQVNENLVLEEYRGTYTEYVYGHNFRFIPSPSDNTVDIKIHDIYFPEYFTFGLMGNTFDIDAIVLDICTTLRDRCPSSYEKDGYQDFDECLSRMKANVPITNRNAKGLEASDGNSTSCRALHANLAKNNADHCPHISYFPEEDKHGNYKCTDGHSYDITFSDLFSESDLQLFEDVAVEFDLTEKQLVYGLHHPNETKSCRAEFQDRQNDLEASLPADYRTTKACTGYLESQNATGENNAAYWGVLAVMFVFVRGLGLYFLRNLVSKSHRA